MSGMVCLKVVECEPLVGDPSVCKDVPKEFWMPLDYVPSYISKLADNKEVARLKVRPCNGTAREKEGAVKEPATVTPQRPPHKLERLLDRLGG